MPKFPEGRELLINILADTRKIEYTLVPNTKGKSDLWKHFNLLKRKTDGRIDTDVAEGKQCNSMSNVAIIPYYCLGRLWDPGTNGRPTRLTASVGISVFYTVFYTGMDIKYRHTAMDGVSKTVVCAACEF